jgi:hypothetical protein
VKLASEWKQNNEERRKGQPAVPSDLKPYLNPNQMLTLNAMKNFGWQMYFIRRPLFQRPTAVMINHEGTRIAEIEENGTFDTETRIVIRN